MNAKQLQRLRADLSAFLDDLMPDRLGNLTRRGWAEVYLRGLLLDGHRKSIQPLAQRLRVIDGRARDYEQDLQQFISQSPWEDRPVRGRLARRRRHRRLGDPGRHGLA
jgi:SRSO17 transposase